LSFEPSTLSVTRYTLYALLIFTPLARGSVHGWAVSGIHLVTLIALTAFSVNKTLRWEWEWRRTPLDIPIALLLILSFLSSLFSLHPHSSLWATVLFINSVVIFNLIIHTLRTRSQFRQLIYLIIGVATFLSIFGLFKRFGANPFPWWDYAELKADLHSVTSTFGNYNHLAGYLEMAIPLILGLFLTGFRGVRLFLMIYLTSLMLAALILSLSRGGWIGFLLGLVFMALALVTNRYFEQRKLVAALAGGFLLVALVVLASTPVVERIRTFEQRGETPNLRARVTVWGGAVEMIKDHPLLGTGPGTFATVFTQYQPPGFASRYFMAHNDYLHFTSEVGLPMIVILVWMIIALYRRGFAKLKNPSRLVRGATLGAMSGVTAILFHSIVDFNLHIPANALLFTVLAAIVVAPVPRARAC
jgi:O-antigen ligase